MGTPYGQASYGESEYGEPDVPVRSVYAEKRIYAVAVELRTFTVYAENRGA